MWLFSQRGYFSIVQHKNNAKLLIVKARVNGDIEKSWPDAKIERNEAFDYLYRTTLPRAVVVDAVHKMVDNIDYASFKGTLEDQRRYDWYVNLWETLVSMQEEFKLTEDKDGEQGAAGHSDPEVQTPR